MDLLKALNRRYAIKKFSARKIAEKKLRSLLEATRLSPSAYGLQPYKLLLIDNFELREQLLEHSYQQQKVLDSSHLVVFVAYKDIDSKFIDDHMRRLTAARTIDEGAQEAMRVHYQEVLIDQVDQRQRQRRQWARDQTYIALGNFLTCAALLEIDACPMTGIVSEQYDRLLELKSKGLTTIAIATLGYRHAQDEYAKQAKVRLALDELIMRVPA